MSREFELARERLEEIAIIAGSINAVVPNDRGLHPDEEFIEAYHEIDGLIESMEQLMAQIDLEDIPELADREEDG